MCCARQSLCLLRTTVATMARRRSLVGANSTAIVVGGWRNREDGTPGGQRDGSLCLVDVTLFNWMSSGTVSFRTTSYLVDASI